MQDRSRLSARRSTSPVSGLAVCLLCFGTIVGVGEGFRNPTVGTFGLSRSGGRTAQIDDATAVTHNPANLVLLTEPEASLSPGLVYMSVTYQSPAGEEVQTEDPWKILPSIYGGLPMKDGRLALGVGVSAPYGLSIEWPKDGPLKYVAPYYAELKTVDFALGLGWQVNDWLRVGAAVNTYWSQLDLRQDYPWALVVGSPDALTGNLQASGDGMTVSGTLGLTAEIAAGHHVALKFRPPMNIEYDGHVSLDQVPDALGGGNLYSTFGSEIRFPTIVGLGYGWRVSPTVRLGLDFEWLEFSRFDRLPIRIETPPPGLPAEVVHNWKNTFTAGIAGDWRFRPGWVLRAGYQFFMSPVPDETLSPTIPDANQQVFTAGLVREFGAHALEIGYGGIFYEDRHIENALNPAFNGNYLIDVHLFSFTYRRRF